MNHNNRHFVRLINDRGVHRGCGVLVNNKIIITSYHVISHIKKERSETVLQIPNSNYPPITLIPEGEDENCKEKVIKERDFIIYELNEPLDHLKSTEHHLPILVSSFSKLINKNKECKVYIDAHINGYRLKSKKAIIADYIQDYLVQCNEIVDTTVQIGDVSHTLRKEKEFVSKGYSGSPVYVKDNHRELFIGIVKMADEAGTFHLVTSDEIKKHLSPHYYKSEKLFQNDFTGTNKDHVIRPKYFAHINNFLYQNIADTNILFVQGVSGIGKTSIVKNVCEQTEMDFVWIDCRWVRDESLFEEKIMANSQAELLVIDGASCSHLVIKENWLNNNYVNFNHIILTSSEPTCYDFILSSMGYKQAFTIDKMTESEGLQLLKDIDSKYIGLNDKKAIYEICRGIPIFMQIVKDMALSQINNYRVLDYEHNKDVFQLIGRDFTHEELSKELFKIWVAKDSIDSLKKEIIFILSKVSNVGMTLSSLKAVLKSEKPYKRALDDLIGRGFVRVVEKPNDRNLEGHICCVHDLIRNLAETNISGFCEFDYNERFIAYVRDNAKKCDLITRIDALILDMLKIWDDSAKVDSNGLKSESVCKKLHLYGRELDQMVPFNSGSEKLNEWITDQFSSVIAKNCGYLIGLSGVFSNLSPSPMIAQMMWCGLEENISILDDPTRSPDSLARANLINCSFSHWLRLKTINRENIVKNVHDHWIIFDTYTEKGEHDLEIAAMLGGLISMKSVKQVMEFIQRASFKRRFDSNRMSYLTIIIGIIEHCSISEKEKYLPYLFNRLHTIFESEAKNDVISYLKEKNYNFDEGNVKNRNTFETKGLSRTVSFLAFSEQFDNYITNTLGRGAGSWILKS
ncbi:hypothetical protein [Spongiimicrobium salis]|uniref:hypothetical protein n=1 Tax=Spongiimicrobium salis TaxID=1667022 RepID=UPI00374D2CA3